MRLPDKFTRGRLIAMRGSHAQLCTRTDYAGDSGDGFFHFPPIGSQEHGASQRDPALTHQDLHIRVRPEPVGGIHAKREREQAERQRQEEASQIRSKYTVHALCDEYVKWFTVKTKPLFWLRLLALAVLCNRLVEAQGTPLGIDGKPIDLAAAIALTDDLHIQANAVKYLRAIEALSTMK